MLIGNGLPDPNSAQAVGWVLLSLAAVVMALNQGLGLVDWFKAKPAPGEVRAEAMERFVTKAECAEHHRSVVERLGFLDSQRVTDAKDGAQSRRSIYEELGKVRVEMGEMERRLNKCDEERTLNLHDRLNEILSELGEVRGQLNPKK